MGKLSDLMTTRNFGIAATVVGALIFMVALLADFIGIGNAEVSEIGVRQGVAIAVGAIVLIVGVILIRRDRSRQDDSKEVGRPQ